MDRSFIFGVTIILLFVLSTNSSVLAAKSLAPNANAQYQEEKKQDDKKEVDEKASKQKKEVEKPSVSKTEIKEVPKARKQSRPAVVAKPNIKVKPVKINRPKIKKP